MLFILFVKNMDYYWTIVRPVAIRFRMLEPIDCLINMDSRATGV